MSQTLQKLSIIGLDLGGVVKAQYNPKELGIDKSVPWQKSPTSSGDQPELQFTSAEGRSMSFELFFDEFETGGNVHTKYVEQLLDFAKVMEPTGAEDRRRPTRVKVIWGAGLPAFEGVIESVSTKYTMFLPNGVPCRCTCSVKFKEASRATAPKKKAAGGTSAGGTGGAT
ncbi:MAG: hypothetical protein IPL61_01810 [Myxococcales bacterium]|nr:hypothetical protein [Myxococcales bacterium]